MKPLQDARFPVWCPIIVVMGRLETAEEALEIPSLEIAFRILSDNNEIKLVD